MSLPFVARSTADALREQIARLEVEVARLQAENRDLVNALALSARTVRPFAEVIAGPKTAVISTGKSFFQRKAKFERQHRDRKDFA